MAASLRDEIQKRAELEKDLEDAKSALQSEKINSLKQLHDIRAESDARIESQVAKTRSELQLQVDIENTRAKKLEADLQDEKDKNEHFKVEIAQYREKFRKGEIALREAKDEAAAERRQALHVQNVMKRKIDMASERAESAESKLSKLSNDIVSFGLASK